MTRTFLTGLVVLAALAFGSAVQADDRPNIIVVMLDDLGFSDLGCYGGEVRTPTIDRLAAGGVRFTNFYNTGRCCPTRASLLTGLYPHETGLGRMTFDSGQPGYRGQLSKDTPTIAERLRAVGYRTAMVGKWHVSLTQPLGNAEQLRWLNHQAHFERPFADLDSYPVARGFEQYKGVIWGVVDYFDPFSLVHNSEPVREVPDEFYITDWLTDAALEMIETQAAGEEPLFLYLAHTAPHWPLHAREEDIARYRDTFTDGWEATRQRRYDRQLKLGLFDAETSSLTEPPNADRDWATERNRRWEAEAMAVHAAMIDRVDQGLAKIVAKLESMGELDNTLIFVLSDNGASPERPGNPGFDRNSETRDGQAVTYFGGKPKNDSPLPGPQTTYAGIGRDWANAANTPFRYWKAQQYEGGICTPMVMHWPKQIAEPGRIVRQVGHVIDLMPTCLAAAGVEPSDFNAPAPARPLAGQSLLPVLKDQTTEPRTIYFEHFLGRAIRQGDWKLVAHSDRPNRLELYNLATDRTETVDLATEEPDRVAELTRLWGQWAKDASVLPRP
jgi:arylsulfatase